MNFPVVVVVVVTQQLFSSRETSSRLRKSSITSGSSRRSWAVTCVRRAGQRNRNAVDIQCIPAHTDLEGNAAADQEAKRGSALTQSSVSMDYTTACVTLTLHQHGIADGRYHSDPDSPVHRRVFTGNDHIHQRWQRDCTKDQCVTGVKCALAILRCRRLIYVAWTPGLSHLSPL